MFQFTLTTIQHFLYYCEVAEQQLKVKVTYKRFSFHCNDDWYDFFDFTIPASGQEAIKVFKLCCVVFQKKISRQRSLRRDCISITLTTKVTGGTGKRKQFPRHSNQAKTLEKEEKLLLSYRCTVVLLLGFDEGNDKVKKQTNQPKKPTQNDKKTFIIGFEKG